jgi:hypothetical protein
MPENLRELLVLHFLQGRSTIQIAASRGVSQPTISRRMAEALELLRGKLRERGIQAGLVPIQTILLHSNQVVPEALRAGLGKIALAKAATAGTFWGITCSAPVAIGVAAVVALTTGTTWVALDHRAVPPPVVPPKVAVAQPAAAPTEAPSPGLNTAGPVDNIAKRTEPAVIATQPPVVVQRIESPRVVWTRPAPAPAHVLTNVAPATVLAAQNPAFSPRTNLALVSPVRWSGNAYSVTPKLPNPQTARTNTSINETVVLAPANARNYRQPYVPPRRVIQPMVPGNPGARGTGFSDGGTLGAR